MRKDTRRRHDAHLRVLGVCTEYNELVDATAGGVKLRAAFGTHVADATRLLALQERSIEEGRAATEQIQQSRRALRNASKAVVKLGKLVHLDETTMATMRLPRAARCETPRRPS